MRFDCCFILNIVSCLYASRTLIIKLLKLISSIEIWCSIWKIDCKKTELSGISLSLSQLSVGLTMTLLNAFPCVGTCGSSVQRLRRKHCRILYKRIPAALSLDVVGCTFGVCAHALLLPHQHVAVQRLPAPCRKLHAILLDPGPIPQVCWKGSRIYLRTTNCLRCRLVGGMP